MMWTLFYSSTVVGNVLYKALPQMAAAWDCLRKAILFYLKGKALMQYTTFQEQKEAFDAYRTQARDNMWKHAVYMEKYGPAFMMTLNLRLCVVHLFRYACLMVNHNIHGYSVNV